MSKILKDGSHGDEVRLLQKKLVQLGYEIEIDWAFGTETKNAVLNLQSTFGYDVDGIVGDGTQHCITKRLDERWNAQAAKEAVVKPAGVGNTAAKAPSVAEAAVSKAATAGKSAVAKPPAQDKNLHKSK